MPSEWTLQTLPVPADARVELVERPTRRMAAVVFAGTTTDEELAAQTRAVRA